MESRQVQSTASTLNRPRTYWALAAVPFLSVLFFVLRYGITFPYWDAWEFVPFLEKSYEGTLSFGELWGPHNAHRIPFPRMVMLGLARLTHWDIRYELALNLALGCGILAVVAAQLRATAKQVEGFRAYHLIPFVSLLVFSLAQWRGWVWGWQMVAFINVITAMGGLFLLSSATFFWWRYAAAAVLGFVSAYSLTNGLAFWGVGVFCLMFAGPKEPKPKAIALGLWIALSLAVTALYFHDYAVPPKHTSPLDILSQPVRYLDYVFTFLGAVVVIGNAKGALAAGLCGFAATSAAVWVLVRRRVELRVLVPYLALSLFALASGMLTGVGRVGEGSGQALSPRYVTVSYSFWVTVFVLLFLLIHTSAGRARRVRTSLYAMIAVLALLIASSTAAGYFAGNQRCDYLVPARDALVRGDQPDLWTRLHPVLEVIEERTEVLKRRKLSVFREP